MMIVSDEGLQKESGSDELKTLDRALSKLEKK